MSDKKIDGFTFNFYAGFLSSSNTSRYLKVSVFEGSGEQRQMVAQATTNLSVIGASKDTRIIEYLARENATAMITAYQNGVKAGFDRAKKEGSQQ